MNIIDISSKSKISDSNSFIENIPLFKIKPMNYNLPSFEFTNVIFQSMASVENFKHFGICNNKKIMSIGKSTQKALLYKGIKSEVPDIPGSIGLKKILENKIQNQKFLIVKGKNGLNDIENFIVDLNNTESLIKKNPQISNQIINNMILDKIEDTSIQI